MVIFLQNMMKKTWKNKFCRKTEFLYTRNYIKSYISIGEVLKPSESRELVCTLFFTFDFSRWTVFLDFPWFFDPSEAQILKFHDFSIFKHRYLHDYWADFKNFTRRIYLRVEIRSFNKVLNWIGKFQYFSQRDEVWSIWDFSNTGYAPPHL